jgi:hypothetical protein
MLRARRAGMLLTPGSRRRIRPPATKEIAMKRYLAILALVVVAAACTSTDAIVLGAAKKRPPTKPDDVAIYRTAEQVPGKYEELALLSATQEWGYTFADHRIYDSIRMKAAQIGANAVILDSISEPSNGAKIATMITGYPSQRKGKAIAIYILPQDTQGTLQPEPPKR